MRLGLREGRCCSLFEKSLEGVIRRSGLLNLF